MNATGCRPLTTEEWEQVLQGLTGRHCVRDAALIILGTKTGFRIKELLSLRVRDVAEAGIIRQSVTVRAGAMKGRSSSRTVPLNPSASAALARWLRCSNMFAPQFADWALFPRQGHSSSITPRRAFGIVTAAVAGVGLDTDRVGTHSLRKTYATSCWHHPSVGKDMVKMAKLLGHKNFSNTIRYIEFLDGSLDAAVMGI
jgi:integrase